MGSRWQPSVASVCSSAGEFEGGEKLEVAAGRRRAGGIRRPGSVWVVVQGGQTATTPPPLDGGCSQQRRKKGKDGKRLGCV